MITSCQELQDKIESNIETVNTVKPLYKLVTDYYKECIGNKNLYYAWLFTAIKILKPYNTVELGAETGLSTLVLYDGMKEEDQKLTSIDVGSHWPFIPGFILSGDGIKMLPMNDLDLRLKELGYIDFLFIDTEHSYQQLKKELDFYLPLLSDGAIVALDDINITHDFRQAWDEIPYEKLDISKYHDSGFGFFIYKR